MKLIKRQIAALDFLINGRLERNQDAKSYIEVRDRWEVYQGEFKKLITSLPLTENTL